MKKRLQMFMTLALCLTMLRCAGTNGYEPDGKTINHNHTDIDYIPASAIVAAKSSLSIYYGHTSHGSQLISGMDGLDVFKNGTGLYTFSSSGSSGTLHLVENASNDAGYFPSWHDDTITYLGPATFDGRGGTHPEVNIVMWSWCGQLSTMDAATLQSNYLTPMATLETTYPGIAFVYFTGHLDGTGTNGTLNRNNNTIREWCTAGDRWLYDFADIECHDPEGNSYLSRFQNDACEYDSDGNGSLDRNWAVVWQDANPGDWYACDPAHAESADVMGNRKAYTAWWLFARISGWSG